MIGAPDQRIAGRTGELIFDSIVWKDQRVFGCKSGRIACLRPGDGFSSAHTTDMTQERI